jgi:acetyltransferase-like isoleucine patch superfamily enzyme
MANNTKRFKKKSSWNRLVNYFKLISLNNKRKFIYGSNLWILGHTPYLKYPKEAKGYIKIGDNVILNSDAKHSNTSVMSVVKFTLGYDGIIEIGNNCDLNGICIVSYKRVSIGSCCQFGSDTVIFDTDFHPVDNTERLKQMTGLPFSYDKVNKDDVTIGNNVWVGWGCIILKGAHIGNNCIVAAGSVVLGKEYPDNSIIAGNPAKVVKNNQ